MNSKIKIVSVERGSPADKAGVLPGDFLVSIDGHFIRDVLDYQFFSTGSLITVLFERTGKILIKKPEYADLGLNFETYLMDEKRSCRNHCVFCFIDQLPKGLRSPLYFKDDDDRLSFLQGNYITLTNLSDSDIERIISMKLAVNVSVHTTGPDLRSKMQGNKNAGAALRKFFRLADAGIQLNCQIVLCPGINDGDNLVKTLDRLSAYENITSTAVVPVGLTRFREENGLYPLTAFTKDTARAALDIIAAFHDNKNAPVYAADELFLIAGRAIPDYDYYGGFEQYENGVGMWRDLRDDFYASLTAADGDVRSQNRQSKPNKKSVITGTAAYPLIKELCGAVGKNISVFAIRNDFFGESVTCSGLVTGRDIMSQLAGKDLGKALLLPANMLKSGEAVFLDDVTVADLEQALSVSVRVVPATGEDLLKALLL